MDNKTQAIVSEGGWPSTLRLGSANHRLTVGLTKPPLSQHQVEFASWMMSRHFLNDHMCLNRKCRHQYRADCVEQLCIDFEMRPLTNTSRQVRRDEMQSAAFQRAEDAKAFALLTQRMLLSNQEKENG
jgi:hypothetical protein